MPYPGRGGEEEVDYDDAQQQQYGSDDEGQELQGAEADDDDEHGNAVARYAYRGYTQPQEEENDEIQQGGVEEDYDDEQQAAPAYRTAATHFQVAQEEPNEDYYDQQQVAPAPRTAPQQEAVREEDYYGWENAAPASKASVFQSEDKPMSPADTDKNELYQAAIVMMKHFLIQTHNDVGVSAGTHNHTSVDDQPLDAHPNDDWRIQYLQTEDASGNPVKLEAKMDTGADKNMISQDAVYEHGLDLEDAGDTSFTVGSGAQAEVLGIVNMRYRAGSPLKAYAEQFYAMPGVPHDIILGMPFLMHSHAITLNPSFAKPQSGGDFLLLETTAASKKTQQDRQADHDQAMARKQANAARRAARG